MARDNSLLRNAVRRSSNDCKNRVLRNNDGTHDPAAVAVAVAFSIADLQRISGRSKIAGDTPRGRYESSSEEAPPEQDDDS
mmetsp:Transcript_22828/g.49689  ORF Transcript_22828/g.49689 Transcript_22828/m.49689 type:complete len:81 (+) Transcript_22828:31-273(+)